MNDQVGDHQQRLSRGRVHPVTDLTTAETEISLLVLNLRPGVFEEQSDEDRNKFVSSSLDERRTYDHYGSEVIMVSKLQESLRPMRAFHFHLHISFDFINRCCVFFLPHAETWIYFLKTL